MELTNRDSKKKNRYALERFLGSRKYYEIKKLIRTAKIQSAIYVIVKKKFSYFAKNERRNTCSACGKGKENCLVKKFAIDG